MRKGETEPKEVYGSPGEGGKGEDRKKFSPWFVVATNFERLKSRKPREAT